MLVNVGTPDSASVNDVRAYLSEFLADPAVIQLPLLMRWMQRPLARLIASRRAAESAEKYREVWTDRGSPLRAIMEDQAAALRSLLPSDTSVRIAMRYGSPSIPSVLEQLVRDGVEDLTVIPMYPHYSGTTTGTVVQELYRAIKQSSAHVNVTLRTSWYDDVGYVNAQARCIAEFVAANQLDPNDTLLMFSAHGLPVSYIKRGDPYDRHIQTSVRLVTQRLGWPEDRMTLAYQSRMGPAEWLQPYAEDMLPDLARRGEKRVLCVPISFVTDCLETLEEIALRYRADFAKLGGELFVTPAMNTHEQFITALRNLTQRGPRPVTGFDEKTPPLLKQRPRAVIPQRGLQRFLMMGVSLRNRIGPGDGPTLQHADAESLLCVKKPQEAVQPLLADLKRQGLISEGLIWNTCQRFEFFGWLEPSSDGDEACVVRDVRSALFGEHAGAPEINVLFGADAWRHLTRTAAGLNSGLPGDRDVLEQLSAAQQTAERAGTAGERVQRLVDEARSTADAVKRETDWGLVDPGYCYAALQRLRGEWGTRFTNSRHVVVGGSTTSRSLLQTLFADFGVNERDATLVYRSHQGGQTKLLRKAIGNGRRVRTDAYDSREALQAMADADFLYFGIDRAEPVLTREMLERLCDTSQHPLTIVDFNTNGSTAGLADVAGVTLIDAARLEQETQVYADRVSSQPEFARYVKTADAWLSAKAPDDAQPELALPCLADAGRDAKPHCSECGRAVRSVLSPTESLSR